MNKFLWVILAAIFLTSSTSSFSQEIKNDGFLIENQDGYKTIHSYKINVSKNKKYYFVISENNDGERLFTSINGKDQSKKESSKNIVMCKSCGGAASSDPFAGFFQTAKTSFRVENYGGAGIRWSEDYTFSYSSDKDLWYLSIYKTTSFDSGNFKKKASCEFRFSKGDFGFVSIKDFPEDMTDIVKREVMEPCLKKHRAVSN